MIGFDIERHEYGDLRYPGRLLLRDVRELDGRRFYKADLIVASPPCQEYSYRAMPWKKARALPPPDNALFDACFRIQREASKAAGRRIPLIVENVRGAQKWVGPAQGRYGSFYLWGDVPLPLPLPQKVDGIKNKGGSWFNVAHNTTSGKGRNPDGRDPMWTKGFTQTAAEGIKCGGSWFGSGNPSLMRRHGSKSVGRKMAQALIAKIPLPLSRHIAATFKPRDTRCRG